MAFLLDGCWSRSRSAACSIAAVTLALWLVSAVCGRRSPQCELIWLSGA